MKISAGVIILNELNEIFLCKVTGQPQHDIPKGLIDDGEQPIQSALRETMEETSIQLQQASLKDLGVFDYIKNKKLHLFLSYAKKDDIDLSSLKCESFFENRYTKKMTPEVEGYVWVPIEQIDKYVTANMNNTLQNVFTKIFENKIKIKP